MNIRGAQVSGDLETKFCTFVPNICGSSVWTLLHMVPRILRCLLGFWKIFVPLTCIITLNYITA